MLNDAQKREAERAGQAEMKRFWGDVLADGVGAAIADIRVHVVEKGWYGQPLYDYAQNDRTAEFYGRHEHQPEPSREAVGDRAKERSDLER